MMSTAGRKVSLYLSHGVYEALRGWAESEGRRVADLSSFLLERALRDSISTGESMFPIVPVGEAGEASEEKDGEQLD